MYIEHKNLQQVIVGLVVVDPNANLLQCQVQPGLIRSPCEGPVRSRWKARRHLKSLSALITAKYTTVLYPLTSSSVLPRYRDPSTNTKLVVAVQ